MRARYNRIHYRLAFTVMLWLIKGVCIGLGALFAWRIYQTLAQ